MDKLLISSVNVRREYYKQRDKIWYLKWTIDMHRKELSKKVRLIHIGRNRNRKESTAYCEAYISHLTFVGGVDPQCARCVTSMNEIGEVWRL